MLRSVKHIKGYKIEATDGDIGKADDFLFDDVGWFVRYITVNTGGWLSGRKVLVAPEAFGTPDWERLAIPVRLSRKTVEDSPPIDEDAPVSVNQERHLRAFYGWPNWWSSPAQGVAIPSSREVIEAQVREAGVATESADPHLRSADEVIGYHIDARDGEIGHVEDLVVDDATWAIRYLVIDTRNLLPGKKVLVAPQWTSDIRWADRKVSIDMTKDQIRNCPEFDPREPINRRYEERIYDFHGRPKYWVTS